MIRDMMKSTTVWGILAMIAAMAPLGVVDPVWDLLATTGMPASWIGWAQTGVFFVASIVALRGRIVASGPLGVK